jgi:hypothetical protein
LAHIQLIELIALGRRMSGCGEDARLSFFRKRVALILTTPSYAAEKLREPLDLIEPFLCC